MSKHRNLVPGKRYRITIEDCCVGAEMYGTFLHIHYDSDEYDDVRDYHFDIGIIGPDWGAWTTEEIDREEQ